MRKRLKILLVLFAVILLSSVGFGVYVAAYSTADLTQSGLQIVQIYGTEDGVINRASYEKYASNLPEGSVEIILEGGNHAGFGAYGPQKKDGAPNISPESQWAQTADAIIAMCSQS